jgi:hypothetical protein
MGGKRVQGRNVFSQTFSGQLADKGYFEFL